MSDDYRQVQAIARSEVQASPVGRLGLGTRKLLWAALGPVVIGPDHFAIPQAGLLRRVRLFGSAVRRVLPFWVAAIPNDPGPQELVDLAEGRLRGDVDPNTVLNRVDRMTTQLQNFGGEPPEIVRASYVAHAASDLACVACGDVEYEPGRRDEDLDQWDAPLYASWAYCGGAAWERSNTGERDAKRAAFWMWFLDQAFDDAIEAHPAP